jgi:tungstate transport system permease protein
MTLTEAFVEALRLLFHGDAELWLIIWISLKVALGGLLLAVIPGVATGYLLAMKRFSGRRVLVVTVQSLLSFPTVVVGLVLYMLLSRHGPLGGWQLLFTQDAMILGQAVLVFPILAAFTLAAVQGADPRVHETAIGLGAGSLRAALTTLNEVRFAVFAAVLNGFGRAISEVGCALMIGGNIAGVTRNITTAIALETSKGEFVQGIALGLVLMVIALGVNAVLALMQGEGGMK